MEDYKGSGNIREKAGEEERREEGDKSLFVCVCVLYVRVHVYMCMQQSLYVNIYSCWNFVSISSYIPL